MTVKEFYENVGGDYAAAIRVMMADKMILRFLPRLCSDPSFKKLDEAWAAGNRQDMFEALHAMKGVCANLGLTRLSQMASDALEPLRPGSGMSITDEELEKKITAIRAQADMTLKKIKELENS